MNKIQQTISFVSGKGGVGKTSLAVNFAWLCSRLARTVLVDLDFQNQGCTGLFLASVSQVSCGSFEVLSRTADFSACKPMQVADNLHFISAVSIVSPPQYALMPTVLGSPSLGVALNEYICFLQNQFSFEIVILDCHGGLDYASVAAYQVSSDTIMVTEADAVTFNGTLELLSFYDSQERAAPDAQTDQQRPPLEVPLMPVDPPRRDLDAKRNIKFVVNRLPPKYKFQDIQAAYHRLLHNYKGRLNVGRDVLSFIPEENFIAESFGEYPFVIKLAPTSIFARKLQLIAFQLLSPADAALQDYRPLRKLRSPRFRKKVEQSVISAEGSNTRNIIQAFGLSVTLVAVLMIGYFIFLALQFGRTSEAAFDTVFNNRTFLRITGIAVLFLFFYVFKAQFGLMFYYRDQYRFQRALLRATGNRPNIWQRLLLLRLLILRLGNSVTPFFLIALLLFWLVALAVIAIGGFFGHGF